MKIPEDVPVKIGEFESEESGITAIFPERGNITGISQRGGAPGTLGTEVLHPMHRKYTSVDAVVFAGRSIFGTIAAMGVIKALREEGKGLIIRGRNIPVVPVAVIFDFINDDHIPDESWGINAFKNRGKYFSIGRHGAGKGATVGKVLGIENSSPSGQGISYLEKSGLYVMAISVVNAFGDVYDEHGKILAGARIGKKFIDTSRYIIEKNFEIGYENTTLGIIITNAALDREDACSVAEAANNSLAGIIRPFNTSYDGDTFFTMAFNEKNDDIERIKLMAQEAIRESVYSIFRNSGSMRQ
ncbi:MAG: P1 family peptidase [Thermoplasmata archaeon]